MLVNKLLNKRDERTEQLVLPVGSRVRDVIDDAIIGIVRVLRKRWMQIRQEGAFADLDPSSLEELAKSQSHLQPFAPLESVQLTLTTDHNRHRSLFR